MVVVEGKGERRAELEGDLGQPQSHLPSSPLRHAEQLPHHEHSACNEKVSERCEQKMQTRTTMQGEPATYSSYHAASAAHCQIASMPFRGR